MRSSRVPMLWPPFLDRAPWHRRLLGRLLRPLLRWFGRRACRRERKHLPAKWGGGTAFYRGPSGRGHRVDVPRCARCGRLLIRNRVRGGQEWLATVDDPLGFD